MDTTNKKRCNWPKDDALYIEYHDTEWGVPIYDDAKIFEFLLLEIFQAGLSWITILKKRENLKKIIKNKKLPLTERFEAQLKLAKIPRNSSKTRIRNRCEITGRPRGVYRKLKISRIALRDLASKGKIPGMTKSSW